MNGAEALMQTLCDGGVEVCFANPGTSEMQLVAAIDKQKNMRAILGLFEGVVTGAADGYGRMKDKPAVTLLHLGPGLAWSCKFTQCKASTNSSYQCCGRPCCGAFKVQRSSYFRYCRCSLPHVELGKNIHITFRSCKRWRGSHC